MIILFTFFKLNKETLWFLMALAGFLGEQSLRQRFIHRCVLGVLQWPTSVVGEGKGQDWWKEKQFVKQWQQGFRKHYGNSGTWRALRNCPELGQNGWPFTPLSSRHWMQAASRMASQPDVRGFSPAEGNNPDGACGICCSECQW